ncbi:Peptide deformylase [Methylobacterium adhaesivum]|uniref:Peptide deformylase-like n=1 Tax=Methylobacterium adhaesivum TaxID=333297 RepID=A0ABT8BHL7_9HYPH|nr:peptide deformylase [Methylobacterium adhaesivum]MDN3591314.1 peptide deformylase [Methylobacterium adhaesivum]GJD30085.1 Peptide deformylase [Methylobacterium adhaesivum]
MPARPLLFFPDPRLRLPAAPVLAFDAALRSAAEDLFETLKVVSALGLTLPHLGLLQRVMVVRLEPDEPAVTYVNPEIVWASPERAPQMEGSVSMPRVTDRVDRATHVRLRFHDLDGSVHEENAEGFRAACLQHEVDQLDGIFWIDRLSRLRRDRAVKRFAKLARPG